MNLIAFLVGFVTFTLFLNDIDTRAARRHRSIVNRVDYGSPARFRPIRISVVRGVTNALNATQVQTLDHVVAEAVNRIQSTVKVNRVVGKLRLARPGGCKQLFTYGVNKDKCASVMEGYRGDFCLDDFKIPSEHQVGALTSNKTSLALDWLRNPHMNK